MSGVLMAWGPFRFEIGAAAYEEFTHSFGGRWERHDIIGRKPAGQYLGPELERVRLRGAVFPLYTGAGSADTVQALVQASGLSTVYALISADGTIHGTFRLEKASRTGSYIAPDGAPQKLVYDLDYVAHDDGAGAIFSLWP